MDEADERPRLEAVSVIKTIRSTLFPHKKVRGSEAPLPFPAMTKGGTLGEGILGYAKMRRETLTTSLNSLTLQNRKAALPLSCLAVSFYTNSVKKFDIRRKTTNISRFQ